MASSLAARMAAVIAACDPWALPAGLEWCEETAMPSGNPGMWAIRSIGRGTPVASLGDIYKLVDLIRRRDKEDPYPGKAAAPAARVTCPDCHGTRVYVGLGFFPAEPCRTCAGTGKVHDWSVPAPQLRSLGAPIEVDPWALPPEAVAAGLGWFTVGADADTDYPWAIERDVMGPMRVYLYEDQGALSGPAGDLDPGLVLRLFDLIKRRNVAEPP